MNIGNWCRRRGGKWHLVESVIADAAITRCGRRMEPKASRGALEVSEGPQPLRPCEGCA